MDSFYNALNISDIKEIIDSSKSLKYLGEDGGEILVWDKIEKKEYFIRNRLTQKEFIIFLIKKEREQGVKKGIKKIQNKIKKAIGLYIQK